ncbi:MAG: hypothetical protein ACSHX8_07085 [Opitutaceae bacterium]
MKRIFPPGTVVRYADDHGGNEDRAYRVVFKSDENNGIVKMKLTIPTPGKPEAELETAPTNHLEIIGWCDKDGNMTWS